jgi:ABC-type transporter Mla subunit MlaD
MSISGTARRLVDVPRKGVALAFDAPQQVAVVFDDVTQLVRRAGRLLDRADLVVARLERKVDEVEALLTKSEDLTARADRVVSSTDAVTDAIGETRGHAEREVGRLRGLLDLYQPMLQALAPIGSEAVSPLKPSHLRSLARLLDEVPDLVDTIGPALEGMANLTPHLEGVSDRMNNVGQVVEGLPGAKLLRRRGQEREDAPD